MPLLTLIRVCLPQPRTLAGLLLGWWGSQVGAAPTAEGTPPSAGGSALEVPQQGAVVEVSSDAAELDLDGNALLSGRVEIRQAGRELSAEDVTYDSESGVFTIGGTVRYRDDTVEASGEGGRYTGDGGASLRQARFRLPERPAQGAASDLNIGIDGRLSLQEVWFSTCPDEPDWRIRASQLAIDTVKREGSGRNAAVEFFGVPILYLPYISFPVGEQRKSGFLFPEAGYSTRGGLELAVPYYFNLAPNYDLTLHPTLYGRRGVDLASRFRYLGARHRGDIQLNYLPSDKLRDRDRNWLRLTHRSTLADHVRIDLAAQSVSDGEYFEDFASGAEGTSTTFLERVARIAYRDEFWQVSGEFQQFQTIDRSLADADRPHARVPALTANGVYRLQGRWPVRYDLHSELVHFMHDDKPDGWRTDLAPQISLEFDRPAFFVRPMLGYRYTHYALSQDQPAADRRASRSLPQAALDAGLRLERTANVGSSTRITLEPRLLYLWTPFRDQEALPIFDTAVPDLDFVQLFRTTRYVGADRVADANQLSTGLTGRVFDAATGRQLLAATLGQIHYFETPQVRLPNESLATRRSDVVAEMDISAWRDITLRFATQWDSAASRQERSQVRLQYRPDEQRAINLTYRFQRDRLQQGELSGAWPVGDRWSLFSRLVHDLDGGGSLDRFAGVEYRACCWRLRAVARRFVSNRSGERETGFYLQLELNGLASVGSGADAFLEQAIRGYSSR